MCGAPFAAAPGGTVLKSPSGNSPATLPINFTVQEAVAQLRVHCRFGLCEGGVGRWTADPARCRAELHTADIASHEAVCVYGPRKLRPRTKR